MKSIMHDKRDRTCYLCMMLHDDDNMKAVLQEHHIFGGTANRKISEKYGLKVYLCLDHHLTGTEAVHRNAGVAILLKQEGQRTFQRRYPDMDFMKIFGKSYLADEDERRQQAYQEPPAAAGEGVEEIDGVSGMDEGWR